ncbi:MAG: hypothetical protein AAFY82_00080 [Pseudomonadota bacterium]
MEQAKATKAIIADPALRDRRLDAVEDGVRAMRGEGPQITQSTEKLRAQFEEFAKLVQEALRVGLQRQADALAELKRELRQARPPVAIISWLGTDYPITHQDLSKLMIAYLIAPNVGAVSVALESGLVIADLRAGDIETFLQKVLNERA